MSENTDQKSHDLQSMILPFTAVNATSLQVEKAKVQALNRQLSRSTNEKRQLQSLLKQAQTDLEKQMQQTLRLQKSQAQNQKCLQDAMAKIEKHVSIPGDSDVQELKNELASTQRELADEISASKKKEERMQDAWKRQQHGQKEGDDSKRNMEQLIKSLEKQRTELYVVVRKQMNLIDILRQQRAHVEAAALLNITEKDFMKEVNRR